MERIALASGSHLAVASCAPADFLGRRSFRCPLPPAWSNTSFPRGARRPGFVVLALGSGDGTDRLPKLAIETWVKQRFASISSSNNLETSSVGTPQLPVSPPPSSFGSPLFWIGVGIAFSALFSWVANYVKQYAMQQAMKTMMSQMGMNKGPGQGNDLSNFPGPMFSYPVSNATITPSRPQSAPAARETTVSQSKVTVDVTATDVQTVSVPVTEDVENKEETRKYAFVDVSAEEASKTSPEGFSYANEKASSVNGAATKRDEPTTSDQLQPRKSSPLTVDALEKMMEDPNVQKMVFPYLPEEMRNPATFKWMLQNPEYRQQLQDMLDNMGGGGEWDQQLVNSLKNFDLNSPEIKQQFDQIGLTPEEVIQKIMANPEIAMSFQNPKVQAAIVDCSENPMNIMKYQNDKEIMDVFSKISQLFPGVSGPF